MIYLGFRFVCGKGHAVADPYPSETRAKIKPDDVRWRKCDVGGCELISLGIPSGLEAVKS